MIQFSAYKFILLHLFYNTYFIMRIILENITSTTIRLNRGSILIKGTDTHCARISRLTSPTSLSVTNQIIDVYTVYCENSTSPCHKEIESRG